MRKRLDKRNESKRRDGTNKIEEYVGIYGCATGEKLRTRYFFG